MRKRARILRDMAGAVVLLAATGCNRHQSTLAPFGEEAAEIKAIALTMVVGAIVIAACMAGLMVWAVRAPEGRLGLKGGERLILCAGGIGPALLLLGLLIYSLPAMRPRPDGRGDLNLIVTGEQFWWRVRYEAPGAIPLETANEIRVPVGRTVRFRLRGGDVIHSFWIPGLAGKMDMIPGRENLMTVKAGKRGIFRGQCAEFCGLSHALMAFDVVAMEPAAFDAWLARQRLPAPALASPGRDLFARYGCGGCHTIRGTDSIGTIGPDLTHLGGRLTIAAGTLKPREANIANFIRYPYRAKPGVRMPSFPQMPAAHAHMIARYLGSLQ